MLRICFLSFKVVIEDDSQMYQNGVKRPARNPFNKHVMLVGTIRKEDTSISNKPANFMMFLSCIPGYVKNCHP